MKKGFILGIATGMVLTGVSLVLANSQIQAILNDQIKIALNGQVQEFKDETTNETQYPITYHDRTYLPLRTVANLVGVDVDWDANSNTANLNNSNKKSNEGVSKNKINFKDNFNFAYANKYDNGIGKYFELAYKATLTDESSYAVKYDTVSIDWYFEKNELLVNGDANHPIKFNNKIIKDVWKYDENGTMIGFSMQHLGDTSEIESGLIILFEDGTVGMLKVSDIIKGSNNVVLFDNVNNVEYLREGYVLHAGLGTNLYGVDRDGHVVFSYEIDPGA